MKVWLNKIWTFLQAIDYDALLNPHVLLVVTVPLIFYLLFPLYWYVFCPWIWSKNTDHAQPKTWLLLYWLIASIVWLVVLIFVYQSKSSKSKPAAEPYPICDSPMEFWQEDHLSNESYQLCGSPSTSSRVTIEQVQPANTDHLFHYGSIAHGLNGPWKNARDYRRFSETLRRYSDTLPLRHARYQYSNSSPEGLEQVEVNLSYSDSAIEVERSRASESDSAYEEVFQSVQKLISNIDKDFRAEEESD